MTTPRNRKETDAVEVVLSVVIRCIRASSRSRLAPMCRHAPSRSHAPCRPFDCVYTLVRVRTAYTVRLLFRHAPYYRHAPIPIHAPTFYTRPKCRYASHFRHAPLSPWRLDDRLLEAPPTLATPTHRTIRHPPRNTQHPSTG